MRKSGIIFDMNTVLIVGASSGIGYACAKKFLAEGYRVLALSRTECVLAGVKNYLCDVSKETALDETLTVITEENPAIEILLYCAGCSMASPLEYVDPADYRYLFEVNFFGFVHCLRRLIPSLRHCFGTACVISSMAGLSPIPFDSYYVSSKAALNAFCSALQTELTPRGVRVLSIMPGGTKTNFTYKRKVYPADKIGDYKNAQERAVEKLGEIEQTGQEAEKVAAMVFEKCVQKSRAYLYVSGWKNKASAFLVRLLPQTVHTFLTRSIFFSCSDQ